VIQLLHALAQLLQAYSLVSMLAAFFLRGDDQTGRQMPETDSALRLVYMLASGAARTEGLYLALAQQRFIGFRQYDHLHLTVNGDDQNAIT
jgi:hypothetical protein